MVLGGHHASLAPDQAIECPNLDALCVSEGDSAVVQLASQLGEGEWPSGIPNLWIRHPPILEKSKKPLQPASMRNWILSLMLTGLSGRLGLPIHMKRPQF